MNGHIFQCSEEQTDRMQFKNTKDALYAYVKTKLERPDDMAALFAFTMAVPTIAMPPESGPNPNRSEEMVYREKAKQYVKRESILGGNMAYVHAVA